MENRTFNLWVYFVGEGVLGLTGPVPDTIHRWVGGPGGDHLKLGSITKGTEVVEGGRVLHWIHNYTLDNNYVFWRYFR